ncbi:MAG: hypothetical protein CM15mP84_00090 [Cellvibrionales bacterium]|nr:MAG: hypothetical protein CM15mP84_00090 [Cellvibrionales bacterium]
MAEDGPGHIRGAGGGAFRAERKLFFFPPVLRETRLYAHMMRTYDKSFRF